MLDRPRSAEQELEELREHRVDTPQDARHHEDDGQYDNREVDRLIDESEQAFLVDRGRPGAASSGGNRRDDIEGFFG